MQVQSPDTIKSLTQGDKKIFHTDHREFDALIQITTLTVQGRSVMWRKSLSS